ncbi:MAG TPA: TonB-dependent receptor [Chitinophaga sp.]|uniref:TonB-dependent receptor n=1 Tax=Chitinophaga sp. TaxID=1869181 RepID=UPI002D0C5188|nr:TonB-dependent receptor [Chitinophaga sp.]HVI49077.1 TonB-dependent receptor [Chitinophaga sp.]
MQLFAQREISGTVYEKDSRQPLPGASVLLYNERSVLKAQTLSDNKGNFELKNPPLGNYRLVVNFIGYKSEMNTVIITEKTKKINLDYVQLARNSIKLNSIEIKGEKSLFSIRKDTIEFDANQFYTHANASLNNLLQKLPGLTIDANGNYFFQGKPIKELYIDGKPVLQDPKRLMEIVKADMISKVQITDKKNLGGVVEPGNDAKVLNLTIRKEARKGITGNLGAGYGTDDRYAANATMNMLREDKMLIGMVNLNNINNGREPGANTEFTNITGIPGVIKALTGFTQMNFDITPEIKVSGSLMQNNTNASNNETTERQNIFREANTFYTNNAYREQNTHSTQANLRVDYTPDQNNKLTFALDASRRKNLNTSYGNYVTTNDKKDTINNGIIRNADSSIQKNITTNVDYVHQFKKQGRMLSANIAFGANWNYSYQYNFNFNNISNDIKPDTINQQVQPKIYSSILDARLSYREPLSKSWLLILAYNLNQTFTRNRQYAYAYDKMGYYALVDSLSYHFQNKTLSHNIMTGLNFSKGRFQAGLYAGVAFNDINSNNKTAKETIRNRQANFEPGLQFSYKPDNYKTFSFNYSGRSFRPDPNYFWPVANIQNPLYIQLGNPDLKPGYMHSLSLNYTSISISNTTFVAAVDGSYSRNAVSTAIYADSLGRQVSIPVNVNGNYAISPNILLSTRLKKPGITLTGMSRFTHNKSISLVNSISNTTRTYTFDNMLTAVMTCKEILETSVVLLHTYTGNKYSIQNESYSDFLKYNIFVNVSTYLPWDINLGSAVNYSVNTGAKQKYTLLDAWVSRYLTRSKALKAKLYVYDILRQNRSLLTTFNETYRETIQSTALQQYFMFSLTYYYGPHKRTP